MRLVRRPADLEFGVSSGGRADGRPRLSHAEAGRASLPAGQSRLHADSRRPGGRARRGFRAADFARPQYVRSRVPRNPEVFGAESAGAAPLDVRAVRRSGAARRYDTRGDLWQWRASSLPRAGARAKYSGARPRGLPTRLTAYAASDSGLSSPLSESIASRFSFILRKARTVARRSASLI